MPALDSSLVVPCFILFVIGIAFYNILFLLRKKPDGLTSQQERALRQQGTGVNILIVAFVSIGVISTLVENLFPNLLSSLSPLLGNGFCAAAWMIGIFIGVSAIVNRVIVFRPRGSSEPVTGCFAVFEGVIFILVIIVVGWVLFFRY